MTQVSIWQSEYIEVVQQLHHDPCGNENQRGGKGFRFPVEPQPEGKQVGEEHGGGAGEGGDEVGGRTDGADPVDGDVGGQENGEKCEEVTAESLVIGLGRVVEDDEERDKGGEDQERGAVGVPGQGEEEAVEGE